MWPLLFIAFLHAHVVPIEVRTSADSSAPDVLDSQGRVTLERSGAEASSFALWSGTVTLPARAEMYFIQEEQFADFHLTADKIQRTAFLHDVTPAPPIESTPMPMIAACCLLLSAAWLTWPRKA